MTDQTTAAPDWIGCGQADRLVKTITEEPASSNFAFRSLLKLAQMGHIRVIADLAEIQFWRSRIDERTSEKLDLQATPRCFDCRIFFDELLKRYGSANMNLAGFWCFLTGVFEFGEFHESSDGGSITSFHVVGLKFSRSDILSLFDPPAALTIGEASVSTEVDQQVLSSTRAESQCGAWLKQRFADGGSHGIAKYDFWITAQDQFSGRLSKRGFDRAWAAAANDFPERREAGRKSKR